MGFSKLSAAAVAASFLLQTKEAFACTAVGVGKDASASGYPMVGHSEDSGPSANDIRLVRVPRKQWPAGSRRPLYHWQAGYPRIVSKEFETPDYLPVEGEEVNVPLGSIPQVSETWAYWDTDYAVQNEWGVSIGESTCTARTVGWPADVPYGYNRVGIEDLSKLALERCKTARCAVETMGNIAVEQGFYSADSGDPSAPEYTGSSECLVLADADPGELWVFNVMTGKNNASAIWAAQKIPDNHVMSAANAFSIRKLNLTDSHNFLYSPGVTSLAEEKGWWSPKQEASADIFDFFGAYGYTPSAATISNYEFWTNILSYYSGRRMWRVFNLLSPEEGAKLDANVGNLPHTSSPYPTSVPAPKHSVTQRMVMDLYRDHYEGTQFDLTKGMAAGPWGNPNRGPTPLGLSGLWERAISMYRTTWSFVLEAKPRGRAVTWFGWDAPHGTAYLPLFGAATEPAPESYHSREGHISKFSNKVAWWAFNIVNQYQEVNFQLINADVRKKAEATEKAAVEAVAAWEAEAEKAGADESATVALLTQHSNAFVSKVVDDWWEFAFSLFAKFGRYVTTYNESDNGEVVSRYPEWWLRSPEVGFTSWNPAGPYHGVMLDAEPTANLAAQVDSSSSSALTWCLMMVCSSTVAAAMAHQVGVRQGKRSMETPDNFYVVQP